MVGCDDDNVVLIMSLVCFFVCLTFIRTITLIMMNEQ